MNREPIGTGSPMISMLTVREAAHLLHVHESTLRRWSNDNKIPSFRICQRGDRRYKRTDVTRFMAQSTAHAGSPKETE